MSKKIPLVAIGTFRRADEAAKAIEELRGRGFDDENIGVLTHDRDGDPAFKSLQEMMGNKAGVGAATGVAVGGDGDSTRARVPEPPAPSSWYAPTTAVSPT